MLSYTPTPVQEIHDPAFDKAGVQVLVKREDLNHPFVSGNKWWKLKYNLEEALKQKQTTLLTFGGAYSNHIYATAAAAKELGLKSIGIIRGEETLPLNETLSFAVSQGMELQYVSRELYRSKAEAYFVEQLQNKYGDFYLIPEGGTNKLAVKGVAEFAQESMKLDFDYLCCAVGTGGTLSGLIQGIPSEKSIIGFSVLKGGEFLEDEVNKFLNPQLHKNWRIETEYHFGGYGKWDSRLSTFVEKFKERHAIQLDHVYTGKVMWGIYDLINKESFAKGSTILFIHSGGVR